MTSIVVVEDSSDIAEILQLILEDAGYEVCRASNGCEALPLLGQVHPAVVISDVVMPSMTGLELAATIRQDRALSQTKIVLMSAKPPCADVAS